MNLMEDEYQQALLDCVKPLMKALPESKKDISQHTGLPVSTLNGFLNSKTRLTLPELQLISAYFNCEYEFLEWEDGQYFHSFTLKGEYTSFPKSKKAIKDLYECASNGGDLVFACELATSNGYVHRSERLLFLHTCFGVYHLIVVNDLSDELDALISKDSLINLDGMRLTSDSFLSSIRSHCSLVGLEPGNRRALDYAFFQDKGMLIEQLDLSKPPLD